MRQTLLVIAALFLAALPLYLGGNTTNPPGFFGDEARICYNALLIGERGVDEWGDRLPLYFRAGGEYQNPVYVYLLAAIFRVTGPSSAVARDLSAILGDLAAAAMGWLAWMLTRRRGVVAATFAMVVLTPALFEISRLVFEVALYPLVLALFLIAVLRASRRERWDATDVLLLALTLSLCTYAYSIGRLYGPLLLAGLFFFHTPRRRIALVAVVALYAVTTLVPMFVYQARHRGALTVRFRQLSYLQEPLPLFVHDFAAHYLESFDPVGQSLQGDSQERHHVRGSGGGILAATFLLAFAGVAIAGRRAGAWHLFLIYALILSLVPVALTSDPLHALRAVPYTLLLIVFASIACAEVPVRWLAAVAVIAVLQSGWFFVHFVRDGPRRAAAFQTGCQPATAAALAQQQRPIYLVGHIWPIASIWYGTLHGVGRNDFVVCDPTGTPPANAVVVTMALPPPGAREVFRRDGFRTYIAPGYTAAR